MAEKTGDRHSASITKSITEVNLLPEQISADLILDDNEDPKKMSRLQKCFITFVITTAATCISSTSSIAGNTERGVQQDLHISHEVAILGISLYVFGLGCGPLLLGPLSEFYGRTIIYRVSYALFFAFQFPIAFANHAALYMIFRFLSGMVGAAFLSVAGGSVIDIYDNTSVANPMAVYTLGPFLGPVLGPGYSGFINQHINWRWTYYVIAMWSFVQLIALMLLPETYVPILLRRKSDKLRKLSGDQHQHLVQNISRTSSRASVVRSIVISCYRPFQILFYERMAFLLDLWTSLILGILYLTFEAFPIIFGEEHHFNVQSTGLSFIGIGVGMLIGLFTQLFYFNRKFRKLVVQNKGIAPPETRLLIGMLGAILAPISLYWLAFTTYPRVHWVVPMLATIPLGTAIQYTFTSVFTFLVTAYRPYAASAMAGNTFMRSSFAAAFPLFADAMYGRLGTVGATALLAGLTTLMVPLPFIFYKYGPRLRQSSKFTGQYQ